MSNCSRLGTAASTWSAATLWVMSGAGTFWIAPRSTRTSRIRHEASSISGRVPGFLAFLGVPGVHLVESDTRKAVFLKEAIRVTNAAVTLHATRIDRVKPFIADVITARALAPLAELLEISQDFRGSETICLFLKGRTVADELTDAVKIWKMR